MDAIALSNLPLASLALVGFFWLLIQMVAWIAKRLEAGSLRTARQTRLQFHARQHYGVFRSVIGSIREVARELTAKEAAARAGQEDTQTPDPAPSSLQERILGQLLPSLLPAAGPEPERPDATSLFTYTTGHLDRADVVANLSEYRPSRAGMALLFVEKIAMVHKTFDDINALHIGQKPREDIVGALINQQFDLLHCLITSRALFEDAFHDKLRAIVTGETDGSENLENTDLARAKALFKLCQDTMPEVFPLIYWHSTEGGGFDLFEITEDNIAHILPLLKVGTFDVMRIDPMPNPERQWLWAPVAYVSAFALLMVFSPGIRDWLYPQAVPSFTCETMRLSGSDTVQTTCTHTAATLEEGFAQGMPPP